MDTYIAMIVRNLKMGALALSS